MKTIFTILLLAPLYLFSQENSWFEPSTVWTYNYQNISGPDQYQAHFAISEAVFAGKDCSKMETTEEYPFQCSPFETPFYFYESNDSIFYATELDNTFRLAYNFNAEVGDSWNYSIPKNTGGVDDFTVEVIAVNTIEIDGNSVKEMILNYQNISEEPNLEIVPEEFSVIEFLGSTRGLFVPFGQYNFCDAETAIQLQCFNNATIDYTNPDFGTCTLSAFELKGSLPLKIFPNPASEFIIIETALEKESSIRIIHVDGKTVLSQNIPMNTTRVSLPELASGVYFVEILNLDNRYIGKLMVR